MAREAAKGSLFGEKVLTPQLAGDCGAGKASMAGLPADPSATLLALPVA